MQARKQYGLFGLSAGATVEVCSYIQPLDTVNEGIVAAGSHPVPAAAVMKTPEGVPPSAVPARFAPLTIQMMVRFAGQGEFGVQVSTLLPLLHAGVTVRN